MITGFTANIFFEEFVLNQDTNIKLISFAAAFILFAILELLIPRRPLNEAKLTRWSNNFALVILNTILLRIAFPFLAVEIAFLCKANHWGIFNIIDAPYYLNIIISIILLDLIIYFQHVVFHTIPALWRVHMVHHTDLDLDLTSGIRFHPIEILLSMGIKIVAICILGAPIMAVLIFEIILNLTSLFNHSNLYLSKVFDNTLRLLIVTPDMHRVHHSVIKTETNSNYGFNLSIWDKLFRTYTNYPSRGHNEMKLGLSNYRNNFDLNIFNLLIFPFTAKYKA